MLIKNILIIFVFLFIGCSTLQYREPLNGPRARVRFVASIEQITVLYKYDDEKCESGEEEMMRLINRYTINSTPKQLGIPLWNFHPNAAKEIFVSTEKRFHAMFKTAEGSLMFYPLFKPQSCGVPFTFDFIEGSDYEVVFTYNSQKGCAIEIFKIEKSTAGAFVRESQKIIDNTLDTSESCREAINKMRLY